MEPETSMYNWNTLARDVVAKGGERVGFRGENVMFVMNFISPGLKVPSHEHDFEQIVICVQGHMKYFVGDRVFEMSPGSMLRVPPHTKHYVEVVGNEVVQNLDVFPCIREDYGHLVRYQAHEFDEQERS
jgi:quercetin dioxygenase-like cupin family protein